MCHIIFTLNDNNLTFMLVGGGEGNKAAKSVTNVRDCVLTFVSVKLLDICEELGSWRSKKVKKNLSQIMFS